MIKVDFEFETKYGKFADAIWYPEDTPMSEEELEAEKQRRLANWLNMLENPVSEQVEPDSVSDIPSPETEI